MVQDVFLTNRCSGRIWAFATVLVSPSTLDMIPFTRRLPIVKIKHLCNFRVLGQDYTNMSFIFKQRCMFTWAVPSTCDLELRLSCSLLGVPFFSRCLNNCLFIRDTKISHSYIIMCYLLHIIDEYACQHRVLTQRQKVSVRFYSPFLPHY